MTIKRVKLLAGGKELNILVKALTVFGGGTRDGWNGEEGRFSVGELQERKENDSI